ncbi:MAG: bifunctional (p)ppGpp synthetase/guanosine-3',5'-bis(diphosphate) 3'-pyrophosphohydrolase [Oscillospiraceae bacterium]|nr:bifunctional (p)ppGpp synthetase/guanosine-3',5'-bis(diphosphate) 3'-pyrophosphohydrolase [Oscillospiraceae bacterium]
MTEDRIVTFETMMQKILNGDRQYDFTKIQTAYNFAEEAHKGQLRSSGQPYIIHPVAVADILLDLGMDTDTICAALLHDVVEDTPVTYEQVKKLFGRDVADLVDGVTKLEKIPIFNKDQQKAKDICKILIAMKDDIRVILIKLCDRLHNMRTLQYRPDYKQQATAYETMNIYAPIAGRLGIEKLHEELEDLSFYYLDPYAYADIVKLLAADKKEREDFITSIKMKIRERLALHASKFDKTPQVEGRAKSIYGMYKKLYVKHKDFSEIYDKYAVRVIVSTKDECYMVLGIIHDMFRPIPNRFKDYIQSPKENNYRSLHTSVLGEEGIPFEVQIRTREMHRDAEYGIAAHWKYKEGVHGKDHLDSRLNWVREALEAQQTSDDVEEIVRIIKNEVSPESVVVVLTPRGDTVSLPSGATPIDFAYKIHTQVGHKAMGAKVNNRIVPLDYELQTGQICDILLSKEEKGPNRAWLELAKTTGAKSKIRLWFKKERREENIETGKAMLEKEFQRCRIHIPEKDYGKFLEDDLKRHNCNTLEDFYASIGYGGVSIQRFVPRWKDLYHKLYCQEEEPKAKLPVVQPVSKQKSRIVLDDIKNCAYKFSQCCNPLPGDDIVGFVTRGGHGISVHTVSCVNYRSVLKRNNPEELERWFDIQWTDHQETAMQTSIEIIALDRIGLMFDITAILTEARIPIVHSSSRNLKNGNAIVDICLMIVNKSQLTAIFEKIRKVKGVLTVERASN